LKGRLKGHGISIEGRRDEGRLVVYDCGRGGRRFRLIVVNGLDKMPFGRHMAEDHLLKVAKILLGEKVDDVFSRSRNAKEAWGNFIDIVRKFT